MSIFECKHFKMQYFTKINMFYTILKSLKKNIKAYFLQNRFDMEYLTIIENKKAYKLLGETLICIGFYHVLNNNAKI